MNLIRGVERISFYFFAEWAVTHVYPKLAPPPNEVKDDTQGPVVQN